MSNAEAELLAALSFGFLASGFVTEPESWPVFMEWSNSHGHPIGWEREKMLELKEVLRRLMKIEEALAR